MADENNTGPAVTEVMLWPVINYTD